MMMSGNDCWNKNVFGHWRNTLQKHCILILPYVVMLGVTLHGYVPLAASGLKIQIANSKNLLARIDKNDVLQLLMVLRMMTVHHNLLTICRLA